MKILQKISVVEWIDMPINLQELIEPWKFEGSFGIHNNSYLQWTIEEKKKHNLFISNFILSKEEIKKIDEYFKKIGAVKYETVLIHYWW